MAFQGFPRDVIKYLKDLERNNNREWFLSNKPRFETNVQMPMLDFITALQPRLEKISPHMIADARKSGGSLMRMHRDLRFSKDKKPYKTQVAAHFRHEHGKDIHAPGFYIHINPKEVFLGIGIWRPDGTALNAIREAIHANQKGWLKARHHKTFKTVFGDLDGDSLKRPPRGYDADHPLIDDLKRKDFTAFCLLKKTDIYKSDFPVKVAATYKASKPIMKFLCDALTVSF